MLRCSGVLFTLLAVYSLVLIGIESCTSQDFVRNFVCDVEGPVPFYAVNTTLSVFLLWATALLFGVCWACVRDRPEMRRDALFYLSQVVVFAGLGIDDRFKLHEHLAWRLGIADHFLLVAAGVVEVLLLVTLGRQLVFRRRPMKWLAAAAVCFLIMTFFDAVYPHDAFLRLSLEDIAKTWSGVFFCLFAWRLMAERIGQFELPGAMPVTRAA